MRIRSIAVIAAGLLLGLLGLGLLLLNAAAAQPAPPPAPGAHTPASPADCSWSIVPSPDLGSYSNNLYGVAAVAANEVWAVGFYANQGYYQTLTEHWNGT